MRQATIRSALLLAGLGTFALAPAVPAQHREYYVRGRVVDAQKTPVPGVAIRLRDVATSRSYQMKTDGDGTFKFAGLPHGVYEASFEKEGYAIRRAEWKFEAPQDRMQKVDVPDVVLVSRARVEASERLKEGESDVKLAGEKLRSGDLDGALALLQGVLARNPRDDQALFFLGLGYTRKKMYREAVDALTQVTQLNPTFPGAYFELGICRRELGDLEQARAAYEKSLELDPANADAAYNAGLILFQTSRIDAALARFEGGLAARPDDPELLEMAARCHLHKAEFETALAYLLKARARATDPAKIAFLDGLIEKTKAQIRR